MVAGEGERWRSLIRAASGYSSRNESVRLAATVELARVCRTLLQSEAFCPFETDAAGRPKPAGEAKSRDVLESLVDCISSGDLKQASLAIKTLLTGYSASTSRGSNSCVDLLLCALERASAQASTRNAAVRGKRRWNAMPIITGIQFCYLSRGWSQTFSFFGGREGEGEGREPKYPLLRVLESLAEEAEEAILCLRLAVQMLFHKLSKTIDQQGAEDTKVKRLLEHFTSFLAAIVLKARLGAKFYHDGVGDALALYSLQQLRDLARSRPDAWALVGNLTTRQMMKVLPFRVDSTTVTTVEVLDILLDFVGGEQSAELQSGILQACFSREGRDKPISPLLPLLCRAFDGSGGDAFVANAGHLAYLAMLDKQLDGDIMVGLLKKCGETGARSLHLDALLETVALTSFANGLRIGETKALLPLKVRTGGTVDPKGRYQDEVCQGDRTLEGQAATRATSYQGEGRIPVLIDALSVRIQADDALVFAQNFARQDWGKMSGNFVVSVCLLLLRHQNVEAKGALSTALPQICSSHPSLEEALVLAAIFELKDVLASHVHGDAGLDLIKDLVSFVLGQNGTPVTKMLAKKALDSMVQGHGMHSRVFCIAIDAITQLIEETGTESECEDLLKILFLESQSKRSAPVALAISICMDRALRAFPRKATEWVDVLDSRLKSTDDRCKAVAMSTIDHLTGIGVFSKDSALKVLAKNVVSTQPLSMKEFVRFQARFVTADMTEEDCDSLLERVMGAKKDETYYNLLSKFPCHLLPRLGESERPQLASAPTFQHAKSFVAALCLEETKLLRHKAKGKGVADDSAWTRVKKQLRSCGRKLYFGHGGDNSFAGAQVMAFACAENSFDSFKQFFCKTEFFCHSRLAVSFYLSRSSWSVFVQQWLYSLSSTMPELTDRILCVWREIDAAGVDGECRLAALSALVGVSEGKADELAGELISLLLAREMDDSASLRMKAATKLCLSLVIPGAEEEHLVDIANCVSDPEILGQTVFTAVKQEMQCADKIAASVLSRLLPLLPVREFHVPKQWAAGVGEEDPDAGDLHGVVLGLGWIGKAAALVGENRFAGSLNAYFLDIILKEHPKWGAFTGALFVLGALTEDCTARLQKLWKNLRGSSDPVLQPLGACLGASIASDMKNRQLCADARLGAAIGLISSLGCRALLLPCHEFPLQSMDRVQLLPDDFLQPGQDIVACSSHWLGQAAAVCMMKATDVLTEETKSEFGKSSYIGLCLEHLERHRDHEPAAICAISSLQALHTSVLDTTSLMLGILGQTDSPALWRACLELIAAHKNTQECVVCKEAAKAFGVLKTNEEFIRFLPGIMSICGVEDVGEVLHHHVTCQSMGTWLGLSEFIARVSVKKPRRYQLMRPQLLEWACQSISSLPLPSYGTALQNTLGLDKGLWHCIATCISKWEMANDIDEGIPSEKRILLSLAGDGATAGEVTLAQRWMLEKDGRSWILPLLTANISGLVEGGSIDLKQWMLDLLEENYTGSTVLNLFANVVLSLSSKGLASASMWTSQDFSVEMLPQALADVLSRLPQSFCRLWCHRFLRSGLCNSVRRPVLVPTLASLREHFGDADGDEVFRRL